MKTKIFGIVALSALCLSTHFVHAQLKFKSIEKNKAYNTRVILNEKTGDFIETSLVAKDEMIVSVYESKLFTQKRLSETQRIIKKYDINKDRVKEIGHLLVSEQSTSYITKSGNLLVTDLYQDGPGKEIKVYTQNFQLVRTLRPFSGEFQGPFIHSNDYTTIVGLNPNGRDNSKLFGFDTNGMILFEVLLDANERIIRVLSSEDLFAINIINEAKGTIDLRVLDKKGKTLWSKTIIEEYQNWAFSVSKLPALVTATRFEIYTYNALNGQETSHKKLTEIIMETGAHPFRNDGSINVDIKAFENGQTALLISEATGVSETKNNILYLFKDKLHSSDQKTGIGDMNGRPLLISTTNEVLIIKNQEILRYEFSKEK